MHLDIACVAFLFPKSFVKEEPTKEPLYFDWELYQKAHNDHTDNIFLDHLE
jgi:hypothetical protein